MWKELCLVCYVLWDSLYSLCNLVHLTFKQSIILKHFIDCSHLFPIHTCQVQKLMNYNLRDQSSLKSKGVGWRRKWGAFNFFCVEVCFYTWRFNPVWHGSEVIPHWSIFCKVYLTALKFAICCDETFNVDALT